MTKSDVNNEKIRYYYSYNIIVELVLARRVRVSFIHNRNVNIHNSKDSKSKEESAPAPRYFFLLLFFSRLLLFELERGSVPYMGCQRRT